MELGQSCSEPRLRSFALPLSLSLTAHTCEYCTYICARTYISEFYCRLWLAAALDVFGWCVRPRVSNSARDLNKRSLGRSSRCITAVGPVCGRERILFSAREKRRSSWLTASARCGSARESELRRLEIFRAACVWPETAKLVSFSYYWLYGDCGFFVVISD